MHVYMICIHNIICNIEKNMCICLFMAPTGNRWHIETGSLR